MSKISGFQGQQVDRKLFGKPIRKCTTKLFFPDKLTIEEFSNELGLIENHGFVSNMRNLGGGALEDKYIEEWTEQFLAWCEIENE